ncbi:MAG: DUF3868 domain-containing protein [Alistipes sp.]|nr:DUF3868 domain-containing protein [Alistipes sp.]
MKRIISYIVFSLSALMLTLPVSAQQIMDGQAEVKNLSVERKSSRVEVKMDVDVSSLNVGADETLVLTPVIEKGSNRLALPSIEIMGRRAWLYWLRGGEQTVTSSPLYADREAKRAERKAGQKQSVAYSTSLPFESWMKSANVVIEQNSCGCHELVALGDSPLSRILHEPYMPKYLLSFVEPKPEPVKVRDESHSAFVNFFVDKYEILENYKNNSSELASIINSIEKVKHDEDLTSTSITIQGWASPEATEQHNKRLSENRAASLADYVAQKTAFSRENISTEGCGEDWAGLRELVVAEPHLLKQAEVLAIIDKEGISLDEKDKQLKALIPETIYQRLLGEMYPKLRRNDYRIVYNVRNFDLEEARSLVDKDPRKLSLVELYKVAGSYTKGSSAYNHVLEVAAKTYPNQVPAAVNAASVLIEKGDYNGALALLSKVDSSDANVLLATGLAYAKAGQVQKAREAWSKSSEKGNAEAKHNLAELAKSLE